MSNLQSNFERFSENVRENGKFLKGARGSREKPKSPKIRLKGPQYIIFKSQNKTHAFSGANRVKICAIGYTEHEQHVLP